MLNKSEILRKLIEEYDVQTIRDVQEMLKDLFAGTIQERLEAEFEDHLGYERYICLLEIYQVILKVFTDEIHYKVRSEGRIINKVAYIAIGINLEGVKEVLGTWIGENESSKYWLKVLTDIKNRGGKDILIDSVDGLIGFSDVIKAVFPNTEVQRFVVHQIRYS
uniref:IS256 family transposase n=1 Tax=Faecalimicrobium dakarense TaxID=1301100 RepID=UPI0004BAF077